MASEFETPESGEEPTASDTPTPTPEPVDPVAVTREVAGTDWQLADEPEPSADEGEGIAWMADSDTHLEESSSMSPPLWRCPVRCPYVTTPATGMSRAKSPPSSVAGLVRRSSRRRRSARWSEASW